jgi:hypothetical protein
VSDARIRELERRAAEGDPDARARHLKARVRAGELTAAHVALAASLGHAAARELDPVPLEDWADGDACRDAIRAARDLLGETLPARVAADWAERVLSIWEAKHPDADRPRKAIDAARAWATCPCDEHRKAAANAANAAADAAYAARAADAADYAADASYAAADAAAADAASDAAYAARAAYAAAYADASYASVDADAAYAAADAAYAAAATADAAYATANAAYAARDAADATTYAAEQEWQRLRLAAYVLRARHEMPPGGAE